MRLISVVMGVDTSDNRTSDTVKLLNYGFNSYKIETIYKKDKIIGQARVEKGKKDIVKLKLLEDATELLNTGADSKTYTINVEVNEIKAPIKVGEVVGTAEIIDNEGNIVTVKNITVAENVKKASIWDYFKRNLQGIMIGKRLINL